MSWALAIDRTDISVANLVRLQPASLGEGEARLVVRRFALTANNVTYAAFGDAMSYWNFFPTDDGTGRLPVWGFAEVVESRAPGLEPGERIYGYFPAASELVVEVSKLEPGSFVDSSAHRAGLASAYNRYVRCTGNPGYRPELEAAQMVLQPLFITAFLIDLHLRDTAFMGANVVSLTSASSKTALALAYLLSRDKADGPLIEAMTSPRNHAFVEACGFYDRVVLYDDLGELDLASRRLIVDFAGDSTINRRIHERLGDHLAGNIRVGGAHWEASAPPGRMPGPKPVFFFAPDHVRDRMKAWGPSGFGKRYGAAWLAFAEASKPLFTYTTLKGGDGALAAYTSLIKGDVPASEALTIALG